MSSVMGWAGGGAQRQVPVGDEHYAASLTGVIGLIVGRVAMAWRHSAAEGGQGRAQGRHVTQQSCFRLGICTSPPSRHLDLLTHTHMNRTHGYQNLWVFFYLTIYLWLIFVKMQLCKSSRSPLQIRQVDPKQVETVIIIGGHDLCVVTLVKSLACLQACTGDL